MLNLMEDLKAENDARKATELALESALKENQGLLSELQHRAKNSFNMIFSMIDLAMFSEDSPGLKAPLVDLGNRVRSISELYDLLYASGSLIEVPLDQYCARIAAPLIGLSNIALNHELDSITIPAKLAAPIGLIVVELITNATKYAVSLKLKRTPAGGRLEVRDDGIGLSAGFSLAAQAGKGLSLVQGLTGQIGGNFLIEGSHDGTRCVLEFAC